MLRQMRPEKRESGPRHRVKVPLRAEPQHLFSRKNLQAPTSGPDPVRSGLRQRIACVRSRGSLKLHREVTAFVSARKFSDNYSGFRRSAITPADDESLVAQMLAGCSSEGLKPSTTDGAKNAALIHEASITAAKRRSCRQEVRGTPL